MVFRDSCELWFGSHPLHLIEQYPLFEADMAIQFFFDEIQRPPNVSFLFK